METVVDVKRLLRPGMWAATVDLKDTYYHIGLHQKSWHYFHFIIDGKIYEFNMLPMGLSCSPRIFTRLTKFLAQFFQKQDIKVILLLDNILVTGVSKEDCQRNVSCVVDVLKKL